MRRTARINFWILGVAALVGGLALCFPIGHMPGWHWRDPFSARAFAVEEWRSVDADHRAAMCRDLISRYLTVGTERSAVILLLGMPDATNKADECSYSIGNWSSQGMDDAFLRIRFDANDRLQSADIYGY